MSWKDQINKQSTGGSDIEISGWKESLNQNYRNRPKVETVEYVEPIQPQVTPKKSFLERIKTAGKKVGEKVFQTFVSAPRTEAQIPLKQSIPEALKNATLKEKLGGVAKVGVEIGDFIETISHGLSTPQRKLMGKLYPDLMERREKEREKIKKEVSEWIVPDSVGEEGVMRIADIAMSLPMGILKTPKILKNIGEITKLNKATDIADKLHDFKIAEELIPSTAKILEKVGDERGVANVIRTSEIASEIFKKTGTPPTTKMMSQIGQDLDAFADLPIDVREKKLEIFVNDVIDNAPKTPSVVVEGKKDLFDIHNYMSNKTLIPKESYESIQKRKYYDTKKLEKNEDGTFTVWRDGKIEEGKPNSFSITQKFPEQKPYRINKEDIILDTTDPRFKKDLVETYNDKIAKEGAEESLRLWNDFEKEIIVAPKVNQEAKYIDNVFKKEDSSALDDIYRNRDKEELSNSLKNLYNNESAGKISMEFDNATAGKQITTGDLSEGGQFLGIKSTFPEWIPKHLKKKPLLNDVIKNLQEGTVPKGSAQRELYNVVVKKIVKEEGLNIKAVKNTIKRLDTVVGKEKVEVKQIKSKVKASRTQAMSQAKKATGKLPASKVEKVALDSAYRKAYQSKKITTSERVLLKKKLKDIAYGSRVGKRYGVNAGREFRKALIDYSQDLPPAVRNKLLSKRFLSGIKSKQQFEAMLDRVDLLRAKVLQRDEKVSLQKEVKRLLKTAREKGLIGKAKMEARKETGVGNLIRITKDGKEVRRGIEGLSIEKLKEYRKVLLGKIDTTPPQIKTLDAKAYKKYGQVGSSKQKRSTKIAQGFEKAIGVISTGIEKYGDKYLKSSIREFRFHLSQLSFKYVSKIENFQKQLGKLKDSDTFNLSYYLYNQNFDKAREVLGEHSKELDEVIAVLDDIHKRANEVGLNVGKLKNYFPRIVKDYDGLFKAYSEKFGSKGRSYFEKILNDYANSKGKKLVELSIEEKSDVLTKTLRGYGQGKINAGNAQRARQFKELPAEFLQYYHAPKDSLAMYISKMNQRIELKKIFGLEGFEQDSIGSMVERVNATPSDKELLKEYLSGILSPQGQENVLSQVIRKSATLAFLANFSQTIFQTADIGKNMFKHGMFRAAASLFRKKPFLRDKMFMDITHEFADSKLIKRSLKSVGFDRLDRLNNEAFMANAFREASRLAKKGKGSGFRELQDYADFTFRGNKERIAEFFDDVKNQKVTDETSLYIWNKVQDVDPRDLMEMPLMYAKHPNLRAAYSMKSYGIKVLDMYRNEARSGKPTWKKTKNMVMLTAYLTAAGATASQLRNWWRGEDKSFSDTVVNQALQIMMMSTYDAGSVERDGLGMAIFKKLKPPTRPLDDLVNDIRTMGDDKGFKSIRNIPIVGDLMYYRTGAGKDKIEKDQNTSKAQYEKISKMTSQDQNKSLAQLKKTSPNKYSRVRKEMKWDKLGVTKKEKKFSSMGVEDGERAEAIARYLKKQKNWQVAYRRLRQAGILTPEVVKQLKPLMK